MNGMVSVFLGLLHLSSRFHSCLFQDFTFVNLCLSDGFLSAYYGLCGCVEKPCRVYAHLNVSVGKCAHVHVCVCVCSMCSCL